MLTVRRVRTTIRDMKRPLTEDLMISADQAGLELRLTGRQVRRFAQCGLIPGTRIGRDWVFLLSEVRAAQPNLPKRGGKRVKGKK